MSFGKWKVAVLMEGFSVIVLCLLVNLPTKHPSQKKINKKIKIIVDLTLCYIRTAVVVCITVFSKLTCEKKNHSLASNLTFGIPFCWSPFPSCFSKLCSWVCCCLRLQCLSHLKTKWRIKSESNLESNLKASYPLVNSLNWSPYLSQFSKRYSTNWGWRGKSAGSYPFLFQRGGNDYERSCLAGN